MAKLAKKNRTPIERLDLTNLQDGIYFDEMGYGLVHPMKADVSIEGMQEYVYKGKIHHGFCRFLGGKDLNLVLPEYEGEDHGFTLEGLAKEIFTVEKGLCIFNPAEKRTFCYTNAESNLKFIGDPEKEYVLFVRFFENVYGDHNNRWAVLFAKEA